MQVKSLGFKKIVLISGIIILFCFALYAVPYVTSRPGRCYPITYPDGDTLTLKAYTPYIYETSNPIEDVSSFFNEKLNATPYSQQGELWRVQALTDSRYLYECFAGVNKYEVESSCILLYKKDGRTIIETVWYFSATATPPCSV